MDSPRAARTEDRALPSSDGPSFADKYTKAPELKPIARISESVLLLEARQGALDVPCCIGGRQAWCVIAVLSSTTSAADDAALSRRAATPLTPSSKSVGGCVGRMMRLATLPLTVSVSVPSPNEEA